MKLLDESARRLLDRLKLVVQRYATASRQGGHRSPVLASGLELADHRPYVAGDDVRYIDWKAFARHRQLTIRQFEEERDARVIVLCDVSSSMTLGDPPKTELGRRLSAAFAYVGTKQLDAVEIVPFAAEAQTPSRTYRQRGHLPEVERFLEGVPDGGTTAFPQVVREVAARVRGRAVIVVVSDLMTPQGFPEAFRLLGALGHQVSVVRVTCADDDKPDFRGELELLDSESGERLRVRMSRELLAAYRAVVGEHVERCKDSVRRVGGRFSQADVRAPIERVLRDAFREQA